MAQIHNVLNIVQEKNREEKLVQEMKQLVQFQMKILHFPLGLYFRISSSHEARCDEI